MLIFNWDRLIVRAAQGSVNWLGFPEVHIGNSPDV